MTDFDAEFAEAAHEGTDPVAEELLYGESGIMEQLEEQNPAASSALEGSINRGNYSAAAEIYNKTLRDKYTLNHTRM